MKTQQGNSVSQPTFSCTNCGAALQIEAERLFCNACGAAYKVVRGIPDFMPEDGYWCNVNRDTMRRLNKEAKESGDWMASAKKIIPEYSAHFTPLARGDMQFLWPARKEAVILDGGAMWGGIAVPAAQYHAQVYALDKTIETLEFLKIRSEQEGLSNIHPVAADLNAKLPFPDNMFDLVVLNGVFEWLGVIQDVVLEKHWEGKFEEKRGKEPDPRSMQRAALRELYRVLKPEGAICITIENRLGIQYFLGTPDDHVNVHCVTLLPRVLANWITKKRKGIAYRTFIYSPRGLKKIAREERFKVSSLYSVFPHYNTMDSVTPFDIFHRVLSPISRGSNTSLRWRVIAFVLGLFPRRLEKYFSPSLGIILRKESSRNPAPSRIISLLRNAGFLKGDACSYKARMTPSRMNDRNPAHFTVYDTSKGTPILFCKVGRKDDSGIFLRHEVEMVRYARSLIKSESLLSRIPDVLGIHEEKHEPPVEIIKHLEGKPVRIRLWETLRTFSPKQIKIRSLFAEKIARSLRGYATRRWLRRIDPFVRQGIRLLAELHHSTESGGVLDKKAFISHAKEQAAQVLARVNDDDTKEAYDSFLRALESCKDFKIPLSLEHGDYDLCNLVLDRKGVMHMLDFEHAEKEAAPFFDLANFLFSPLLVQWKRTGEGEELEAFSDRFGWREKIREWADYYVAISGLPRELVTLLPQLGVIAQHAKHYPPSRDPNSYLMYGDESFRALMRFCL